VSRRWVVEVCHSWMNRFRKLLVRYEKKARNYQGVGGVCVCHYYLAKLNPGPPRPYSRISSKNLDFLYDGATIKKVVFTDKGKPIH
jgi:hypothetical protein